MQIKIFTNSLDMCLLNKYLRNIIQSLEFKLLNEKVDFLFLIKKIE